MPSRQRRVGRIDCVVAINRIQTHRAFVFLLLLLSVVLCLPQAHRCHASHRGRHSLLTVLPLLFVLVILFLLLLLILLLRLMPLLSLLLLPYGYFSTHSPFHRCNRRSFRHLISPLLLALRFCCFRLAALLFFFACAPLPPLPLLHGLRPPLPRAAAP